LYYIEQLFSSILVNSNIKWKQNGITIAGGNGKGNELNQLDCPEGIYVDDNHQTVYIADTYNNRIIEWKFGAKNVQVIADGNGERNISDQLYLPINVIVDNKNDSFIICERENRQVVRWPRRKSTYKQIIISDIDCFGLTMDNNGDLYVANEEKSEVRRWRIGETDGTIVAGGNGQGDHLNQLLYPQYIFLDKNQSLYVSDYYNHRVMKWEKDAKEGIVVAGGNGRGDSLRQLNFACGVIVDDLENIYVADSRNNRIMRWSKESRKGSIVVGGNAEGKQSNQFSALKDLSFDRQGNLYIVDSNNQRIQKFDVDLN
jgi:sugar lactone lactonase YvrE